MNSAALATPVGMISLVEDAGAITDVRWGGATSGDQTPVLQEAVRQVQAYFAGDLTRFTVPMSPKATPFQHVFYEALFSIPFGETRTYGEIAKMLDVPAQAIGQACGANPIPIIIPCHRVLGADGLGGYSGLRGVETKVWLLKHEGAAGLLI